MNKFLSFVCLIFLLSCSSLKRQKMAGALLGSVALGTAGNIIGKELSPNPQSNRINQALGSVLGGGMGFYLGSKAGELLWQENPEHQKMETLLFEKRKSSSSQNKNKIQILAPQNLEKIKLKSKLPPFLKGKVKEASVVSYDLPPFEEQTEDGRTIYHEAHKAYEYVLE